MAHTSQIRAFSGSLDFDFEIRCALGNSTYGAGEPGEILAAVADVRKGDHEGWFGAWTALGQRTLAAAKTSAEAGHDVSASGAYLRASAYYAVAVNAASSLADAARLDETFARQQEGWAGFIDHTPADVTPVAIPYEGATLPGWFFRPARPASLTLVLVNGSDGSLAALWGSAGAAALSRGYNVLVFDGPGQQSQLFERGIPFRPDWENVLTPVFDFVVGLDGVDASRVAVYGISQGGYWVARAIAFEHRFAAAITDPGVVDVSTSWTKEVPQSMLRLLDSGEHEKFDKELAFGLKFSRDVARTWQFRARPYGTSGYAETFEAVRRYTVADVADRIRTPLLILAPEGEQFWPGQSEQLAELTAPVSTLMKFTAAEGADLHCQPLARTLTTERMYDWLEDRIGS